MIVSLSNQAYIFFITIFIGLLVGLIYDFFRLIRKLFTHKPALVYIEDFLFWLFSTFVCFYILLHKNNLELRFYLFIGILIGLCFYFNLFSQFILKIFEYLICAFLKPLAFIIKKLSPLLSIFFNIKNKAIYREKIFLQKVNKYGKMRGNNIKTTIKIIFKKI